MAGSAVFLLDVLSLGVSYSLHLVGVVLEEVRNAVGVGAGGRKTIRLVNQGHPLKVR